MEKKEVIMRINRIFTEVMGVDPKLIRPGASLTNDLKLDPLDRVELIMHLEDAFKGLIVSTGEEETFITIQHVYDFVIKEMGE